MAPDFHEQTRMAEAAFRTHPNGIQVYAPDRAETSLYLIYANPEVDRLLGMSSSAHPGATVQCVLPPAENHGIPRACLRALHENAPIPLEDLWWIGSGLESRWLALTAFPCFEGCVGLMFEDVTERRIDQTTLESTARELSAEIERRKRSAERLSQITYEWTALFDSLPEMISIIDEEFKLHRVNRALADFVGCEARDLVGRKCYEVMHGRDTPWEGCPHLACLQERRSVTKVVEDAAIGRPLMVTCSPLLSLTGQAGCSVHVARDISNQRVAEHERETLIQQLKEALSQVQLLRGLIPICAWCKKVRDDSGYWEQLESYFQKHTQTQFSHGLCPDCARKLRENSQEDI